MAHLGVLRRGEAGLRRALRKAVVRQRRRDDVEGRLVLLCAGRQERQDLDDLKKAAGPWSN